MFNLKLNLILILSTSVEWAFKLSIFKIWINAKPILKLYILVLQTKYFSKMLILCTVGWIVIKLNQTIIFEVGQIFLRSC